MNASRLVRHAAAFAAAAGLFAVAAPDASATHFRYGTIKWEIIRDSNGSIDLKVTTESAWRRSFYSPLPVVGTPVNTQQFLVVQSVAGGNVQQQSLIITPTSVNPIEDWFVGGSTHTFFNFPKGGLPARVYWSGNARISTLLDGNNDRPFMVEARVPTDTSNLFSPSASILPIINVAYPLADATFLLPAADTDGDALTWSIAPIARSSLIKAAPDGSDNIPPATLSIDSATGLVHWATNTELAPAPNQELYSVQFLVTDARGAEIPVDALLRTVLNAGTPPVAKINGSESPFSTEVNPGTPVSFTFCGEDVDFGATVTLSSGGMPVGAGMTPNLPFSGVPPKCSVFNWTPVVSQAGSHVIAFAVTDNFSQQDTISATIIVRDNFQPSMTCPADVTLEATGPSGASVTSQSTVADSDGDNVEVRWLVDAVLSETDLVPGGVSTVVDFTHLYAIGAHALRIEARDGITLPRICNSTVTVTDGAPIVTVPADMTLEATSPAGAVATFTATATDVVDGALPVTCTPASGSTFPLGPTTVSCSATDSAGNTTTATFLVTVVDTTPPVVTVPANMLLEATSPAGAAATFSASAVDIVDGNITPTCTPASGSTFPLGTTTVTCSATDAHNNTGSASFTVTVQDTTPPVVTVPANMLLEATGPAGAVATFSASAVDIVDGNITPTCTPASGSTFPLGTTTVTCSATDAHNNTGSASFTVTVQDTTPPVVTVPANMVEEATSPAGDVVTFSASAVDIVDGSITPTCTPASGSTFPLGTTTVTCSATDAHNNTGSASFTITVQDTTPPVITVPANMTVPATTQTGAIVTFVVTATDIVDQNPTIVCLPPSGSFFLIGTTTVNCTATDDYNNSSTGSFTVTVVDVTPPPVVVTLNPGILWPPNHKMVRITVNVATEPGATCAIFSVTSNEPLDDKGDGNTPAFDWIIGPGPLQLQLRAERQGPGRSRIYTVTVKCTDAAGNVGTGTATAVVPHDMGPAGISGASGVTDLTPPSAIKE